MRKDQKMNNILKNKFLLFISIILFSSFCTLNIKSSDSDNSDSSHNSSDSSYSSLDLEHFSQSEHSNDKNGRSDFNEEVVSKNIEKLKIYIDNFKSNPHSKALENLLKEIYNIANKSYNENKVGNVLGTHKHTLCKDFIEDIKIKNRHTPFDSVHAEYQVSDSRFDVVWFNKKNKNAYIFDYKFGDDNNASTNIRNQKYKKAITDMGYTLNGSIVDIRNKG